MNIPFTAIADLRLYQWRAVGLGGNLATDSKDAKGISMTKPNSGDDGTMTVDGRSKFVAGGAISKGARLNVTSGGFMVTATSGGYSVGFAETATTSGSVGRGVFDFSAIAYIAD